MQIWISIFFYNILTSTGSCFAQLSSLLSFSPSHLLSLSFSLCLSNTKPRLFFHLGFEWLNCLALPSTPPHISDPRHLSDFSLKIFLVRITKLGLLLGIADAWLSFLYVFTKSIAFVN